MWQRVSSRHNRPPNNEMQRTSPVQHGGSPLISVLGGEHEARATIQVYCFIEGTFHGQNNRYYRYHKRLRQGLRWTGIDKNESLQLESATRIHRIDENDSVPRRFLLGSNMPVSGLNGSVLVARFLYRLADFLPRLNATIPWAEVVAGMLRMSYVTDVLRTLEDQLQMTQDTYRSVHTRANVAITMFQPDCSTVFWLTSQKQRQRTFRQSATCGYGAAISRTLCDTCISVFRSTCS